MAEISQNVNIEMLEKLPDGTYKRKYPKTTKEQVGLGDVDNVKQMPISGGILENYSEKLVVLNGTNVSIDLSLGNVFTHELTGNTNYTIVNGVPNVAQSFTLLIKQGGQSRSITFSNAILWANGEIPDISDPGNFYLLTFFSHMTNAVWLGMFEGEF